MWRKHQVITIASVFIILTILVTIQGNILGIPEENEWDDYETEGRTIMVDVAGDGLFRSIQQAINWAKNGDIIQVKNGVYREHIIIDKSVSIIGKDKNTTIIDGIALGDVVTINADEVSISDVTIQNSGMDYDHGIRVNGDKCMIKDSCIKDNYHGILCYSTSQVSVLRNDFLQNKGTAIKIYESDDTIISSNHFDQNDAGLQISDSRRTLISTNLFTDHTIQDISISQSSDTTIMGNTIIDDRISSIQIYHSKDSIICQNHIDHADYGIKLYHTTSTILSENQITNTRLDAILLSKSSSITISKNIIMESRDQGITLINSSDNTVIDNTIDRCYGYGITVGALSSDNLILDNRIINNIHGLCIDHSVYNTIKDNFFDSQGISFKGSIPDHWTSHTIENNKINDGMINCYKNDQDIIVPDNTGQLIIINSTNVHISNLTINHVDNGILIFHSSCITIDNNTITNMSDTGVYVFNSSFITISDNIFFNNDYAGIELLYSKDISILKNHVSSGDIGIRLFISDHVDIFENQMTHLEEGIFLYKVSSSDIGENDFSSHTEAAIKLDHSDRNRIYDNRMNNTRKGLYLYESKNNSFFGNTVRSSQKNSHGFYIAGESSFQNDISSSNTVNELPMHWYVGKDHVSIEDVRIEEQNINNVAQIMIYSCHHVRISDCTIQNGSIGIYVYNASDITIQGSIIHQNRRGIKSYRSSDLTIIDNWIQDNNQEGIYLIDSSASHLVHNTIIENGMEGILQHETTNITIENNLIQSNGNYGISIYTSTYQKIIDNHIRENRKGGVIVKSSISTQLRNNRFTSNGLMIDCYTFDEWDSLTIKQNTIDNKTIRFYKNETGVKPPSDTAQIILCNCSDIHLVNLDLSMVHHSVQIAYSSGISIDTCQIDGVSLYHSNHTVIRNNSISASRENGISISGLSHHITISNNTLKSISNHGITIIQGSNDTITSNIISDGIDGIFLALASDTLVSDNTIHDQGNIGITIQVSKRLIIKQNRLLDNPVGCELYWSSSENWITENIITGNGLGIRINDAHNNIITQNNIIDNAQHIEISMFVNKMNDESFNPIKQRNQIKNNYWDRMRLTPKLIVGTVSFYVHDHFGGTYTFPWLFCDWNPSIRPHNLE